jgi:L-serine/L-threonine ammonia-lyase
MDKPDTVDRRHPNELYIKTPLIKSEPLTKLLHTSAIQRDVYIKLDNLQRSGSYKDRGMAYFLMYQCFNISSSMDESGCVILPTNNKYRYTKVVCSSGGNAGLAAATVAHDLQLHCTVVVPITTKAMVIDKLQSLHANVIVTGKNWNEADIVAQKLIQDDRYNQTLYVPHYDHPLLWTGISSIIQEIYSVQNMSQFKDNDGNLPSTIIVSVGGGGLLCGIIEGLQKLYHTDTSTRNCMPHIICAETNGAASFNVSWTNNQIVPLHEITSIATSLGALSITPSALQRANEYQNNTYNGTVMSALCSDAEAVDACLKVRFLKHYMQENKNIWNKVSYVHTIVISNISQITHFHLGQNVYKNINNNKFARDHRMLVEPACGAALAVLYSDRLRHQYFPSNPSSMKDGPIIIEVCGGSGVNIDLLKDWETKLL